MKSLLLMGQFFLLIAQKGNKLYAVLTNIGILVSYDLQTEKWGILAVLPKDYIVNEQLFWYFDGGKLYFLSEKRARIFIYDILIQTSEELYFLLRDEMKYKGYKIASIINYEEKLIILPFERQAIVTLNKSTKEIQLHSDWEQNISQDLKSQNFQFLKRNSSCILNGCLYILARCEKQDFIFSISLKDMRLKKIYQTNFSGRLFGLKAAGNSIWIQNKTERGSRLVCWSPETDKIEKMTDFLPNVHKRAVLLECIGSKLFASFADGHFLIIDQKSLDIEKHIENSFLHTIQNNEILLLNVGTTAIIVDYVNNDIKKIILSQEMFLDLFIMFAKTQIDVPYSEHRTKSSDGREIFCTLCSRKK